MHRCLSISDVLLEIFDHVDADSKATTARLARVCKTFHQPAVDVLYTHIVCFYRFLTCLPSDLWIFQHVDRLGPRTHHVLGFKRALCPSEWEFLIERCSRVKSITELPICKARMSTEVLRYLRQCPVPCLFPNLRSFRDLMCWADGTAVLFDDIFCSPSLRYFEVCGDAFTVLKRMPSLVKSSPLLETFKARNLNFKRPGAGSRSIEPSPQVSKALCGWKHLRNADCGLMDPAMLAHIARLPKVDSLSIDVYAQSSWITQGNAFGRRAVKSLNFRADRYSTCAKALDLLFASVPTDQGKAERNLASVTEVSVKARAACPSDPSILDFTSSLATSVSPTSLTSLGILINDQRGDDTDYVKTGAYPSLRPLSVFSQLTSFLCDSYTNHVLLKGTELLDLAKNWPLLRVLDVRRVRQPLRITELAELLRCCKNLRVLKTEVLLKDADVMAVYRETLLEDGPSIRNEHIDRLWFKIPAGGSRMPRVDAAAPLLGWLFPRLATIQTMSEAHIEFWCQVAEFVEMLGQRPAGEVKVELWEM